MTAVYTTTGTVIRYERYGSPAYFAYYQPKGTRLAADRMIVCTNDHKPQPGDTIEVTTDETQAVQRVTINGATVHERPPVSGGSPELDEPRLPDAKTMQEITAAVQRKVGTNPTREQVAAALDAVMAERLQDILTLAQVIADNKETAARFMAEQLQPTIHLQGIGNVRAKPADELRVGDTTLWNYGAKEIIQSIEQTSKAFITVYVLPPYADRYATPQPRRLKRSRLVGIAA